MPHSMSRGNIAGLGFGTVTVVVAMFSSEMTPQEIRGRIGTFFQWLFTFGIFVSYWVDYGVALGPSNSRQWQIPIGLQLVPRALLGLEILTLKESTRWLTKKGRHDQVFESLKWIRADEMEDIRLGVEMESRATEGFRPRELLQGDNFKRIFAAFAIFAAQQATGATAFAYFGPQYFNLLVGSGSKSLLLTAIFGAIEVAACGIFVLFVSEPLGRSNVLIAGASFMAACQVTTAVVVKAVAPPDQDNVTNSDIATVALIYLFVIAYNFSWGPMPRLRSSVLGFVSLVWPLALARNGYLTLSFP